jgi:hypothetical protein
MNPLENQDPLNDTNPRGDPLLNALEHSTEYPTGFMDPWTKYDYTFMDDIGKQLQNLEASIDNSLPVFEIPDLGKNDNKGNVQNVNFDILEPSLPPGDIKPSETINDLRSVIQNPSSPVPQGSYNSTLGENQSLPRLRHGGGGCGRKKQGLPFKRNTVRQSARTNARVSCDLRYCVDSYELVDKETCESCEKYHHWPEGTDEEPRECWYAWQLSRFHQDEADDDNESG